MGFSEEQNKYYRRAAIRLIRQQVLRLMKDIPVVEFQQLNQDNTNPEVTDAILRRNLTEAEINEYSIWSWLLMKLQEKK